MDTKALKDKILQLAIQGKLVPQDENDEPASVLLEKIKAEKEQLIKEKKIKKEKPLPEITEDEIPYELPKGWEWVRLGEIGDIVGGGTPKTSCSEYFSDNEISWITPADLSGVKEKYISKGKRCISKLGLEKSSAQLMPKGSVLFSSRAPIGYVAIASNPISTNQGFKSCVLYEMGMSEYIYYVLRIKGKEINENASGTTFKEVSGKIVSQVLVPIPPLNEQKRIVNKIDYLFELIDELSTNKQDLLQNISDARNKVLQLAVQGKLVPQDENDESASVLLEKIKVEKERLIKEKKIKKEKPLPEIAENEIPYELPKGWEWVRLGNITICRDGERIPLSKIDREERKGIYDYYGASGVIDKIDGYLFEKPLLLIGEDGANLITRSKPIAFIAEGKYWVNNHAHVLDASEYTILKYIEKYINFINLKPYITGTAQPKMNQAKLNSISIPLPSLNEQKRIVEKLDYFMEIFDKLEEQLTK